MGGAQSYGPSGRKYRYTTKFREGNPHDPNKKPKKSILRRSHLENEKCVTNEFVSDEGSEGTFHQVEDSRVLTLEKLATSTKINVEESNLDVSHQDQNHSRIDRSQSLVCSSQILDDIIRGSILSRSIDTNTRRFSAPIQIQRRVTFEENVVVIHM